jgi:hypothetical protein
MVDLFYRRPGGTNKHFGEWPDKLADGLVGEIDIDEGLALPHQLIVSAQ